MAYTDPIPNGATGWTVRFQDAATGVNLSVTFDHALWATEQQMDDAIQAVIDTLAESDRQTNVTGTKGLGYQSEITPTPTAPTEE